MATDILQVAYREYSACMRELIAYEKVIIDNGGTLPAAAREWNLALANRRKPAARGKTALVRALSAECIGQNSGHAHREVIHAYLAMKGTHLTLKRLSAYLSESPKFVPDREKGWSVTEHLACEPAA